MNTSLKPVVTYQDLGLISYQDAWYYQQKLHDGLKAIKASNQGVKNEARVEQQHYLLFCEHPHVYTLGKSGSLDHLLLSEEEMKAKSISFYKINRGGDITYHGPGQLVGYPIFDLDYFFTDVHKYVRFLEEAVILTLKDFGVVGERIPGYTGVWVIPSGDGPRRKICAIGVHLSRWVTMHGFAFNVNTSLDYFGYIIPCGIEDKDKTVTSLTKEIGEVVELEQVKRILKKHFLALFDYKYATLI